MRILSFLSSLLKKDKGPTDDFSNDTDLREWAVLRVCPICSILRWTPGSGRSRYCSAVDVKVQHIAKWQPNSCTFETPSSWWSLFIIPKINAFWQKTHQRISENFWSFGFWHAVFTSDPWKLNDQWLGIICSIPMRFFKLLKISLHFGGWLNWAISSFSWNVFVEIFENSLSPWRASRFPKGSREPARIGRRADPRPLKKLTWQYNISYCHIGSYESIET